MNNTFSSAHLVMHECNSSHKLYAPKGMRFQAIVREMFDPRFHKVDALQYIPGFFTREMYERP